LGILDWNFYQTFVTVSIEFWLRFEPQIRATRLAINFFSSLPKLKGRFVCVWNRLIFFVGEYSSVLRQICPILSQIQWRFLGGISGKNHSGTIFQKFCKNQGYPLPKLVKFRPNFCNFILGLYCAEKNLHKHFRMLFAPRQGGTSINESQKEYKGKKNQDVLFSENRFSSISIWDLQRLTPWVFWCEIFTRHSSLCLLSFGWGLSLIFVPHDWQ